MRIALTQGQYAIIDDADYDWINQWKWHAQKIKTGGYYASTTINGQPVLMHRLILDTPDNLEVDHKIHNTLDNRRLNLRNCNRSQNNRNRSSHKGSSQFKGVCFDKAKKMFRAYIYADNKQKNLGFYQDENYAARVYNAAAQRLHGTFACLNTIVEVGQTGRLF